MPSRRQLLQLGLSGLTVSGVEAIASPLLASNPRSQLPSFGKAQNVIVMFTWGGMSHIDTFDPKAMLAQRLGLAAGTPDDVEAKIAQAPSILRWVRYRRERGERSAVWRSFV